MNSESYYEKLENCMINAFFANNIDDEKKFDETMRKSRLELYIVENNLKQAKNPSKKYKELIELRDTIRNTLGKNHLNYIFDRFYELKKEAILKLINETSPVLLFNDLYLASCIINTEISDLAFKQYILS
jgi:hypothetical protein